MPMAGVVDGVIIPKDKTKSNSLASKKSGSFQYHTARQNTNHLSFFGVYDITIMVMTSSYIFTDHK